MKRIFLNILLIALLPVALFAQSAEQDKSFRMGKLKNGLTYYIRHNAKEAGIADFYIAQRVGSILEEPRQRGLAHFLEHMAFNGTKNFRGTAKSPGIIPWCESIGVRFGTNLNAYTSVDQTVYNVSSVPVKRDAIVDSTLLILYDWSHNLLLTDKEIDKERGVIEEEWRTRRAGMATQRMSERIMPVIYQGTKYEDCLPIGSIDIIRSFPYKDLKDYYQKWYRPDLQAIIVVGDIDVDRMEAKIKKRFGSIPMPKKAAERLYYPVNDNEKMIVAIDKDSEQPIMLANLYMKRDATPDSEKHGLDYQRGGYVDRLITWMMNERLNELQRCSIPPCLSVSAHTGQYFVSRTKDAFSLSFGCRQENVKGSFLAAIGEVERAKRYGFTASELQRAKLFLHSGAESRHRERNDRKNRHFVRKALQHFVAWEPILSDDEEYRLIQQFDEQVTLEEVNAAVKEMVSNRNQVLAVYAPDKPNFDLPSAQTLESYVLEAQAAQYDAYVEKVIDKSLMSALPVSGTITKESRAEKHGVVRFTLSNGVEVYVKPTIYSKDNISMRFYGEGGTSLYPDADVPNFSFIGGVIANGGVGTFSNSELQKLLVGKNVKVAPSVGNETQAINGSSSVGDFETMLQLMYLYFTQPRRDEVAFSGEMDRMHSFLTNRDASPQVTYNDSLVNFLYGNHPRVQPLTREKLSKVSLDRIMEIYKERFSDASNFKMILVGNVNIDSLRPLLCKYVASLPSVYKKETFAHTYPPVRNVNETHIFHRKTNTPSALVNIYYTFDEPFSAKADLELDIFRRVLTIAYTDSVREEKGGTYGVSVQGSLDRNSTPSAFVKISFRTAPGKYEELMPVVYKQIEHIAKYGPVASSMEKTKKFLVKTLAQNSITNRYWDYVLYNEVRHGVDFHTGYEALVNSITPKDIQRVAQDILTSNRRIEVTMMSE